jgi:hypothetical protein
LPRLVVRVGVTGHRELTEAARRELTGLAGALLGRVRDAAAGLLEGPSGSYAQAEPELRVVSPCAPGADQAVAAAAVDAGVRLVAPIPFPRATYLARLEPDDRRRGEALLAAAAAVVELDGAADDDEDAYRRVGEVVLDESDLLIAIWDGMAPRGPGGTGAVVEAARGLGIPVVHVPFVDGALGSPRLARPGSAGWDEDDRALAATLADALRLPDAPAEAEDGEDPGIRQHYLRDDDRAPAGLRAGIARRFGSLWSRLVRALGGAGPRLPAEPCAPGLERVHAHYVRADALAIDYVGLYRSSFLANFLLGAAAVLCAVLGALTHAIVWSFLEIAAIAAIGVIYRLSKVGRWRQRATDFRLLAELLRTTLHLAPLRHVLKTSRPPAHAVLGDVQGTWMHWLARALTREAGVVSCRFDEAALRERREDLRTWTSVQGNYHESNASRLHAVQHRLHQLVTAGFAVVAVACAFHLVEGVLHRGRSGGAGPPWILVFTAALPALISAVHAISVQAELKRIHRRSQAMRKHFDLLRAELDGCASRAALVRVAGNAAEATIDEVVDWRRLHGTYTTPLA